MNSTPSRRTRRTALFPLLTTATLLLVTGLTRLIATVNPVDGPGITSLKVPFRFEPVPSTSGEPTGFLARGPGYAVLLQRDALQLRLSHNPSPGHTPPGSNSDPAASSSVPSSPSLVRIILLGTDSAARLSPVDELPGRVNYFRGNDPALWRRNVPTFAKVRCQQIYPGIDLVYYGTSQEQLEYDFIVAPGADPERIALAVAGADRVNLDSQGDLVITATGGQVRLRKPVIYQLIDGHRHDIAGAYEIRNAANPQSQISFQIAAYDPSLPLIIDPILDYATYLGGTGHDSARAIAVDTAGNAYIAGVTQSADFPTEAPLDEMLNDNDAFVVKLNADGSGLVYATYFGGSNSDSASGLDVDASGSVYLTGDTWSAADFPLVNPIQPNHKFGGTDAFVAKLNPEGNAIVYSTFLGGNGNDAARGIAVDALGRAAVAGVTSSTDFPVTTGSIQDTLAGAYDVFVTKLSADGSSFVYSTYLGGSGDEFSYELPKIAMDPAGHAFVTGLSGSTDFPTTSAAVQPDFGGGANDLFVSKLSPDGSALAYSTHLGGADWDAGSGSIALDSEGCAYVVTSSASSDFPRVPAPLSHTPNYPELLTRDGLVCVVKISPDGSSLRYAARLPGAYPGGLAVDGGGYAWIVGNISGPTAGWSFPAVNAIQPSYGGGDLDATLLKLSPDADTLLFASYFGGSDRESALAVATGPDGSVYVVGETTSTNLLTLEALQPEFAGTTDAFVLRLDNTDTAPPTILAAGNYGDLSVVTIDFSEALDLASATHAANYALDQGAAIVSASMGINSRTVRLQTTELTPGTNYTLSVSNILDRAPVPNAIADDTTVTFSAVNLYRGFLRQENYSGIEPDGKLESLTNHPKFPNQPDATTTLHDFEIAPGAYYQDGIRLYGWLLPPVTGEYTFHLCNVSEAALYLSRNESPFNTFRVAFEIYGPGPDGESGRSWNHSTPGWNGDPPPNVSLPIHLEAGRAYYAEVRSTSSAGNLLGVAWQMPGQPPPRDGDPPIPGAYLALLGDPTAATVTIIEQPSSVVTAEGQSVAFIVKATASEPRLFYQWRKNGLDIPGANTSSLFLPELSLTDDGSAFDCVVTVPGASATSQPATLSVNPDVTPPTPLSAEGNVSNGHLSLTFSEPIRLEDATNTANFTLSGGLTVSNAVLLSDRKTVVLTTSPQTAGESYTVQASGIGDRSAAGNAAGAGVSASFFGWADEESIGPFPSWANIKEVYGAVGDGVADDTDAIQQALSQVAMPGHAAIIYFPAGTYRITRTLEFVARESASLIGEDPPTTIIKWGGPVDGEMMFANGVAYSRWSRLTWDGSGTALIAVRHGHTGGFHPQVTQNQHTDEIFRDVGAGLLVDPVNGGDTHLILRCHFLRCWIQGIAVHSYNAIDWHIWDSVFEDCQYGLQSYVGNFHVYRSLFLRSTEADIRAGLYYTGIRDNLSIGSKVFVENLHLGQPGILQGNTVLDALEPTVVRWVAGNGMLVLDNTFITDAASPESPAVNVANNLVSMGNTYTAPNPIATGGRNVQTEDRIVSPGSFSPPPLMIPRFLPKSTSPVIEVPVGANAVTIQQAIDAAVALNGQRPIVHLPAGRYELDRTLIIPADSDLQLVGDGFANYATTLVGPNLPGVPVIFLTGPSRATLRDFHVLGTGAGWPRALGSGIVVEDCDQPGARVFLEQVIGSFSLTNNLVVNRLDHTDVSGHDFNHGAASGVSLRVIGGADQAAGQRTTGRVAMFGGGTGGGQSVYSVEQGGRLLVQDCWYEGEGTSFLRLSDFGTFTLNNARIAAADANHGAARNGVLQIDDFKGRISLLNNWFWETTTEIAGDGSQTELLLLGSYGEPNLTQPIPPTYLVNESPNARVEHWFSESDGRQIPHTTEPDPVFLRKMLEQVRTEKPRRLVPLPQGVTDVRIYRVSIESCKYSMILSGSNAPPELPSIPIQYGDEGSLLLVTNVVTGPDAPYGLYAFTFGAATPAGMTMDPDSGVIHWTPTEAQGPSTHEIPVIVTAYSSPLLKATNVVTLVIREANQPPVLRPDRDFVGTDIGHPPYPGWTAADPDGSIAVTASGVGTYVPGDDFHFSHQQVTGDFDVGVQISGMVGGTTGASAGLMARVSLDFDSPFIQFTMNPPGGYAWYPAYRLLPGEPPTLWHGSAGGGGRYPTWLRLQRQGQTFRALVKYEDTDWYQVDDLTLPAPFPERLYLGLCTWSWAAGQFPGDPPPQVLATYRDYRNFPVEYSHALVDRTVDEGDPIVFQALARDPDVPSVLTFSLDPGAPEGASIDPVSGLFTWTPSEAQGPGTYPITVRVTDNGEPPLSDALAFIVTVNEVNAAPRLAGIGDQTIEELQTLAFTVSADDADDLPPNTLTLSASSLPPSAFFDPLSGAFAWTPTEAQGSGTYQITFVVTDDGIPPLSDAETITITVIEPPRPVTVFGFEVRDGQFHFTFAAQPGRSYLIQVKNDLNEPLWIDLLEIPATTATIEFADPLAVNATRYYRVITGD
jgi:pectin methylesterase-like acyl-CoA thioesterase